MRKIFLAFLASVPTVDAFAHTLAAESGLVAVLGHELLGTHHLPLLLLLAGAGVVAAFRISRSRLR